MWEHTLKTNRWGKTEFLKDSLTWRQKHFHGTLTPKLGARLGKSMAAEMSWAWIAQCSSIFRSKGSRLRSSHLLKNGTRRREEVIRMYIIPRRHTPLQKVLRWLWITFHRTRNSNPFGVTTHFWFVFLWVDGRVWFNATVLKTVVWLITHRGFKSYSTRQFLIVP